MASDEPHTPEDYDALPVASRGVVFVLGDHVCLEVPELGRLEFPPSIAREVARGLLEGSKLLEERGPQKQLVQLIG